jgi:hypothetical protein
MRLRDILIPTEYNDYKPWIITPQALAVFCVVIWGLRFLLPSVATQAANTIDATDLMNKINLERTQRFIPALTINSKLSVAATAKSQDMITRSYFAHVDPDGNYVWPKVTAAGYTPYLTLGENLAMDFTSANDVINAWMNSPTHRANIVNEKFEDQGLGSIAGFYEASRETIAVTSLFGTLQKTPPPPPAPTPTPTPTPTPPAPTPTPTPSTPAPTPPAPVVIPPVVIKAEPTPTPPPSALVISEDAKIGAVSDLGKKQVNINVVIQGEPALVTARLKGQSITLKPGTVKGEYLGTFTFDPTEEVSQQLVAVEARDKSGVKIEKEFKVFEIPTEPSALRADPSTLTSEIPLTTEAQVVKVLRILFGILASIYLAFLIIDAIIIHRARVNHRPIHTDSHILMIFLVATVTLLYNWF